MLSRFLTSSCDTRPSSPCCPARPAPAAWLASCALSRTGSLSPTVTRALSIQNQVGDLRPGNGVRIYAARAFEHHARRIHDIIQAERIDHAHAHPLVDVQASACRDSRTHARYTRYTGSAPVSFSALRRSGKTGCRPRCTPLSAITSSLENLRLPTTSIAAHL